MASISSLVGTAANNLLTDPALLDPVSKLRVSTPQSMIDTDFEYGIQTTKWEYLLTVNNTPAYYIKPGSKNPITVTSFFTTAGSLVATITAPQHNLIQGVPIEILGLADYSMDGVYAVRKVTSVNTFVVRLRVPARTSGEQITPYSTVNIGGIMTAGYLAIANTWSVANSTNLYIQTSVDHGLVVNSSITILNTVNFVPRAVEGCNIYFSNAWYPNVAMTNVGYGEYTSILTPPTIMGNSYLLSQVMPYNWMSANVMMISNAGMNSFTTQNVLTTNYGHGFDDQDNYAVFIMCPPYSNIAGGLANLVPNAGAVYWANVVTPTTFVIRNSSRYGAANVNVISINSHTAYTSNNVNFPFLLMKNVCEVSNIYANGLITFYSNHFCNAYDSVVFANLGGVAYGATGCPLIRVSNNLTNNYVTYGIYPISGNSAYLSNIPGGNPITSFPVGINNPLLQTINSNTFMIQLQRNFPENNSLWWPGHNLVSNQSVYFQGNTSYVAGTLVGPRDNTAYFVDVVNANRFRLKQNLVSFANTIDLIDATNVASTSTQNFIRVSYISANLAPVVYMQNHGILNNDILLYNSNAFTGIIGLANSGIYYGKYVSPNYFRIATDPREVTITSMARFAGSNSANLTYTLNPGDNVFSLGDQIYVNMNSGEYPDLQGTVNVWAIYPQTSTITVNLNSNICLTDNIALNFANCTAYKLAPIFSNGITTQFYNFTDVSTVDGYYQISNVLTNNIFSINVGTNVWDKNITVDMSNVYTANISNSSFFFPNHSLADGAPVTYSNNSNPSLIGYTNGLQYYVIIRDANNFSLSDTYSNALGQAYIKPIGINRGGIHSFISNNMIGNYPVGQVTSNLYNGVLNYISGNTTTSRFTTSLVMGKRVNIINSNNFTGFTSFVANVTNVYSDYSASLSSNIPSNTMLANTLLVPMSILVEPSGYVQHRPFDGGVLLTTGTDPYQSVVRQTRTYFRYQAGKGAQMSSGTNFNPPLDCDYAFQVDPQTIQVQASKTHGFSTPFLSNIIFSGTTNFVNGTFPLVSVIDPYNFQLRTSNTGVGSFSGQTVSITDPPTLSNLASGGYQVGSNIYIGTSSAVITGNTLTTLSFSSQGNLSYSGSTSFFVAPVPQFSNAFGYPRYCVQTPSNVTVRIGMFDSQNGMFFENSGGTMYCVRRNAVQQIGGIGSFTYGSSVVLGTNTSFTKQLGLGNVLAIRGMTYIVNNIASDTQMTIVPGYRGTTGKNIVISKVIDTRVPQSQWSLDKCDGTGPSGFVLDSTKMQMVYIDFAWYGAGKVRFGFKNQFGKVFYVHEFVHGNLQNVAYLRSGNMPARYELRNDGYVFFQPYLFHWGTSVIIDGMFSDDKNYYFTGDSDVLTFTNGVSSNITGNTVIGSSLLSNVTIANSYAIKTNYVLAANSSATVQNRVVLPLTKMTAAYTVVDWSGTQVLNVQLNQAAVRTSTNAIFTIPGGNPIYQYTPIPVLSIRLSPSADNSVTGALGARDLVTRMQLVMKACDATVTHETQVQIFLNCDFSYVAWTPLYSPSLAQYYKHQVGDSIKYGIQLISFRAGGGNLGTATSNVARSVNTTTLALDTLAILSNSIFGGDGVYPNGPDTITVCMTPIDTSSISATAPYTCACRLSWIETQA